VNPALRWMEGRSGLLLDNADGVPLHAHAGQVRVEVIHDVGGDRRMRTIAYLVGSPLAAPTTQHKWSTRPGIMKQM
jgi:hypothetical protein